MLNKRITIAKIDISSPLNGRKLTNIVPKPKAVASPKPQAAHPGAKIPKSNPLAPLKPNFAEFSKILDLYIIRVTKIPLKILKARKDKKLEKRIVLSKPIKILNKNAIKLFNP